MEIYYKFRGLVLTVTLYSDADGNLEVEKVECLGVPMCDFTDEEYDDMLEQANEKVKRDAGF